MQRTNTNYYRTQFLTKVNSHYNGSIISLIEYIPMCVFSFYPLGGKPLSNYRVFFLLSRIVSLSPLSFPFPFKKPPLGVLMQPVAVGTDLLSRYCVSLGSDSHTCRAAYRGFLHILDVINSPKSFCRSHVYHHLWVGTVLAMTFTFGLGFLEFWSKLRNSPFRRVRTREDKRMKFGNIVSFIRKKKNSTQIDGRI